MLNNKNHANHSLFFSSITSNDVKRYIIKIKQLFTEENV